MKIVIFGLGSIGQRHARILCRHFKNEVFAFRSSKHSIINELNIRQINSWDEMDAIRPEVAFITNPTDHHIETALRCASSGAHLFIEKPLSHNMENIDLLESVCRDKKLTCYTAYCLRFHPVIRKVRELAEGKEIYHSGVVCSSYLPFWRENTDTKESYSSFSRRGGGVLLDLSHEFDYVEYLFGEIRDMKGFFGKVSDVTVDSEDFADVLIKTAASIHVNLHIDFNSLFAERTVKVDFRDGYLAGDLLANKVEYFYKGKTDIYEFDIDRDGYLKDQSEYFFGNIGNPAIMNNLAESKNLLLKILKLKDD